MNRLAARLCIIGGALWGLKPLYDWLVLDRRINTGYVASDITDYVKFLFPLLCLGGVFVLLSLYKEKVRRSVFILAAAILFNSLFHFFEIYNPDSGIPFGLLFMFFGTLLLLIGSLFLIIQLKGKADIPASLSRIAEFLFAATLLFCMLPFVSGSLSEAILTPIMVALMMMVGFIWAALGSVLLILVKKEASGMPKKFVA